MALIQNHYEINVALNGQHFFATDARSITDESKLKRIIGVFNFKFPLAQGFTITVTKIECVGKPYEMDYPN
jgi:hypothetical protein